MESETDKSFSQSTLQQSAQRRLTGNDAAIAQREREINDIAQGIIELADIFKDLQTMVIDQGTMLDRIDYNVERMTTDVKGAEKELIVVSLQPDLRKVELISTGYFLPEADHEAEGHLPSNSCHSRHDNTAGPQAQAETCRLPSVARSVATMKGRLAVKTSCSWQTCYSQASVIK